MSLKTNIEQLAGRWAHDMTDRGEFVRGPTTLALGETAPARAGRGARCRMC
jgi:hypothetical protein